MTFSSVRAADSAKSGPVTSPPGFLPPPSMSTHSSRQDDEKTKANSRQNEDAPPSQAPLRPPGSPRPAPNTTLLRHRRWSAAESEHPLPPQPSPPLLPPPIPHTRRHTEKMELVGVWIGFKTHWSGRTGPTEPDEGAHGRCLAACERGGCRHGSHHVQGEEL